MAIADLGQAAARAREVAAEMNVTDPDAEEVMPEVVEVDTAFLVYRLPTGQVVMNSDINALISPQREPVIHDVIGMTQCVTQDAILMGSAPAIAQATVSAVENAQRAAIKQMQDQQIYEAAQKAAQNGGHVPPGFGG